MRRNQGMVDEIFTSLIPPECVRYQGAGRWGKEGGIRKGEGGVRGGGLERCWW